MRIINLRAENIKKLTAVDITPTQNLVLVTGKNGAGKSSILDSIVMALCGGKAIPEVPIKKGAEKGNIVIDLGEFTVIRTFTKNGSYLKIENKDGAEVKSPQKFLDNIVGNISFDPLDFMNNEKKKQRDILLQLIGVDVKDIDNREKEAREARTVVGRDLARAEALYKSIPFVEGVVETKEVSSADYAQKLQDAMKFNVDLDKQNRENEDIKAQARLDIIRVSDIDDQIQRLTEERTTLQNSIEDRKAKYLAKKQELATMVYIDTAELTTAMSYVDETNKRIRQNIHRLEVQKDVRRLESEYKDITGSIESILAERVTLLSGATMPVAGLSFDDAGLTYNGIPLDQASDGEKLMVSLGISMALNPTLRVLRIKDGSLLDLGNREIIKSMIADKDYQLWFESVGSEGKVGIIIEEGEIVAVDGAPVVKPAKKEPTPKAKAVDPAPPIEKPKPEVKNEEAW
jgi:DNA repair exonuclease SbcCD ATPase subunit